MTRPTELSSVSVRNIGQGEVQHRKYERLKFGGGQAYDRSGDWTAVVAEATVLGLS
jgi:hypothetical protein